MGAVPGDGCLGPRLSCVSGSSAAVETLAFEAPRLCCHGDLPSPQQAFDDCTTLSSTFKLLDSFEGLLEREAIAAELAKKQARGLRKR